MKRLALWIGIGAAVLAALIAAAILSLPYLLDLPRVQALAAASASHALGRPVRFTSMSVHLLPVPRVELQGLEVAEDPKFGTAPFVTLERGFLLVRLRPLLGGRLEFSELRLEHPLIRLVEGADGSLNVASLGVVKEAAARLAPIAPGREPPARSTTAGASLLAAGIAIEKGTVSFVSRSAGLGEYRLVDVDLRLRSDGPSLTVAGRGILTPGDIAIHLVDGRLAPRGVRSLMEAPLSGQVSFEGADLRRLVATVAPAGLAVGGPVRGMLSLGGVLGVPHASGRVLLSRAVISRTGSSCRPPERTVVIEEISVATRWTERTLLGRPLSARVAGGEVTTNLSVTLDHDRRIVLSDIGVRGLSLEPVLVDFLCHGYAVTGRLNLTAALTLRAPDVPGSMSGEGRFDVGRGRVVGPRALKLFGDVVKAADLAASIVGEETPSPFEFESITGSYRLRDGVATMRDLLYTGRGFTVTGAGDYVLATGGLNVDLSLQHRREQVKARVTGTADAPVLRIAALGSRRDVDSRTLERGVQDILRRFR